MRWSVSVVADGDREMSIEETVEQAVATAAKRVFADREIEASFDLETGNVNLFQVLYVVDKVELAMREFVAAAKRAGLPEWPVSRVETIGEDGEEDAE